MKSYPIEEGIVALVKDDEIREDSISFRISIDTQIQPCFCLARKMKRKKYFIYVQFPNSESSCFIYVLKTTSNLLDLLPQFVLEAIDLIEQHNLLGENNNHD
tara:strand:+ start:9705 stop:10010 length:306 start_codon:yes stop_codon:yes gene_type:complete